MVTPPLDGFLGQVDALVQILCKLFFHSKSPCWYLKAVIFRRSSMFASQSLVPASQIV